MEKNKLFLSFKKFPELQIALSQRKDGNMKVFHRAEKDEKALANRKKFLNKLGLSESQVVSVKSIHDDGVEIVSKRDGGSFIHNTDGLITNQRNVFLSITVADCLPVIIFDPQKEVIGLIHCGWKGLDKRILKEAVIKIEDNYAIKPEDLIAGIGPGIGSCHYEVKDDFLAKFNSYPGVVTKRDNKYFADLKLIAKRQLKEYGIKSRNIEISPVCTYCQSDKYFSYRKDRVKPVNAMMFLAGFRAT